MIGAASGSNMMSRVNEASRGSMAAFAPALFRSEHLDGDTAGVYRAGPAGIERHVGDQPFQLGLRHAVVERPLHMAPHLVGPVERSQHCHRDQAPVTLAQVGMFPYVAEQHVVAELSQLGNELVHRRFLLSHVSISSCMGRDGDSGSQAARPYAITEGPGLRGAMVARAHFW